MMDFGEKGYLILKGAVDSALCDLVVDDYERSVRDGAARNQSEYHYGGPPRDFGLWRRSEACRRVAALTAHWDGGEPFQTLNFKKGSSQPLHRDRVHFDTVPPDWMYAAWVALEDVVEECGPLVVHPGSHRVPRVEWEEMGLPYAEYGAKDPAYLKYEEMIAEEARAWKPEPMLLRKGDAVLFGGSLIHGGSKILDPTKTRYSQVTHYWVPSKVEGARAPIVGKPKEMGTKDFKDPRNWEAH